MMHSMKKWFALAALFTSQLLGHENGTLHYFCTVSDEKHYPLLINLIGSIHKNDFNHLDEIAVFDIGLNTDQRETLERMAKVKVFTVEKKHPDMLTPFLTANWGKVVRGWYSWKPVLMKQALDMYPYFLFLDAGSLVLNSPDKLFKHIDQNGYLFVGVSHNIVDRMTSYVKNHFVTRLKPEEQQIVMDKNTQMIAGGVQGLSRYLYFDYIFPLYLIAGKLEFFSDDGSANLGFGSGRHDQTLMSILVRGKKYHVMNPDGWSNLKINNQNIPFHYHWNPDEVIPAETTLFSCRWDWTYSEEMPSYILWK